MWMDEKKKFFEDKYVEGGNLERRKINFDGLVGALPEGCEDVHPILNKFEKAMCHLLENGENVETEPIKIKDDKVVIEEGTLYHVCQPNLESLEGIAVGGLLCSEWFGVLESEQEGRFCAFLAETTGNVRSLRASSESYVLFFDTNNPLMQSLVKNDFFEYIKRKRNLRRTLFDKLSEEEKEAFYDEAKKTYIESKKNDKHWNALDEKGKENRLEKLKEVLFLDGYSYLLPQKLKDKIRKILKEKYEYDDLILDLFDEIIEPLSPSGRNFHDNENEITYYWKAIPGGIPSSLINGIKISKENISKEEIEKIKKLFPTAVVFDKNGRVLSRPLKNVR